MVSSVALISFMCLCYAAGHLYYSLFLIWCGFKCYFELVNIKRNEEKDAKNVMSKVLEWYIPLLLTLYLTPKTFVRRVLVDNHALIDFKAATPYAYNILFV